MFRVQPGTVHGKGGAPTGSLAARVSSQQDLSAFEEGCVHEARIRGVEDGPIFLESSPARVESVVSKRHYRLTIGHWKCLTLQRDA